MPCSTILYINRVGALYILVLTVQVERRVLNCGFVRRRNNLRAIGVTPWIFVVYAMLHTILYVSLFFLNFNLVK